MNNSHAFSIDPPPESLPVHVIETARQIEPATLGHMLREGFTGPAIRCMVGDHRVTAGTVVTCRADGDDNAIVHYAISHLRSGDFLVVERSGDTRAACVGGGLALAAQRAGCTGILVQGPVTDLAELRQCALPIWATGLTALTSKREYRQGDYCAPVMLEDFCLEPGMLALGDENGVVFLTGEMFEQLAPQALAMQERQAKRRALLTEGAIVGRLNGTLDRFNTILSDAAQSGVQQ